MSDELNYDLPHAVERTRWARNTDTRALECDLLKIADAYLASSAALRRAREKEECGDKMPDTMNDDFSAAIHDADRTCFTHPPGSWRAKPWSELTDDEKDECKIEALMVLERRELRDKP